jgi:hypothetical protein
MVDLAHRNRAGVLAELMDLCVLLVAEDRVVEHGERSFPHSREKPVITGRARS